MAVDDTINGLCPKGKEKPHLLLFVRTLLNEGLYKQFVLAEKSRATACSLVFVEYLLTQDRLCEMLCVRNLHLSLVLVYTATFWAGCFALERQSEI